MENSERNSILKIAFVGPESTGKSTLSNLLSQNYNDEYVPEFAREYLANFIKQYSLIDIEHIAMQQALLEEAQYKFAKRLLFCDTNLLVTKIWAKYVFNSEIGFIEQNYFASDYDLHFLCDVDIPWQPDPLRENPNIEERMEILNLYEEELKNSKANYFKVSGDLKNRTQFCKQKINELISIKGKL